MRFEKRKVKRWAAVIGGGVLALGMFNCMLKRLDFSAVENLGAMHEVKEYDAQGREIIRIEPNIEVRVVIIHEMERRARESPEDYPSIITTLCAFVRENAPFVEGSEAKPMRPDVHAALVVLGSEAWNRAGDQDPPPIDLRFSDLRRADLKDAHFEGANLSKSHLEFADLHRAHLEGVDLSAAHLRGANLDKAQLEGANLGRAHLEGVLLGGAHLERANLGGAHLERAHLGTAIDDYAPPFTKTHLEGADLTGAHLERANLARTEGLTQDQINKAFGDWRTKLPEGLTRPESWKKAEVGSENSEEDW